MKITFICPVISHARIQRRMKKLKDLNVEIDILSFERDYYPGKLFFNEYTSLGEIEHANYLKRLPPLFKSLPKVRRAIKNTDVIYTFGLDNLFLGYLANKTVANNPKIVYEVGDIRGILLKNNFISNRLKNLEKFLINRINLLVVTSEAYVTGYYKNILNISNINYQVIENKVVYNEMPAKNSNVSRFNNTQEPITIGYFGVLRCQKSWDILKKVIRKNKKNFRLYLRGIPKGIENFEEPIKKVERIEYGDSYKSPDDLPEMYKNVDLVWACYPYQDKEVGNWQWARTTRFYEACFFERPIIAQKGTEDARIVNKYDIGKTIDLENINQAANEICDIEMSELKKWRNNIKKLPAEIYTYTNEHKDLYNTLK